MFNKLRKILSTGPKARVRLTEKNLESWPKFHSLYIEGKVFFDKKGRLRYLHGAPVGDLILVRMSNDGEAVYKESCEDWFDPDGE